MPVAESSFYPDQFDTDANLLLAQDGLRVTLAADYTPGDTQITVTGDALVMSRFPSSGVITLTEQCSDVQERAISFSYEAFDATTGVFSGLILLPRFPDVPKPKGITNVTQNVMAFHHNNLKNAIIAIQEFAGVEGAIDLEPFGDTLEGRINYLRNIVLPPKAWFTVDRVVGIVPFKVNFNNRSFRLGTDGDSGTVTYLWDFGDNTTSTEADVEKTYTVPGIYTVSLTVSNDFGEDTCVFTDLISARIQAPDEAIIRFVQGNGQLVNPGTMGLIPLPDPIPPSIRAAAGSIVEMYVPPGENPETPGKSYGGEVLDSFGSPIDPILNYNWVLGDDVNPPNNSVAKAIYSVGGVYDLKLRVDTEFGAYRITTYENAIDIVESRNLWLWLVGDAQTVRSYEFGLTSQTFKAASNSTLVLDRNEAFLHGVPEEERQRHEFRRNNGAAQRGTLSSGRGGSVLIYYASGREPEDALSTERVEFVEYTGFTDTYVSRDPIFRPWNWFSFASASNVYFFLGTVDARRFPNSSPTNQVKTTVDLLSFASTEETFTDDNYDNGAEELVQMPASFGSDGEPVNGRYAVYRTAWKSDTGYVCRNDNVGAFFRISDFYRTEGSSAFPFQRLRKLQDIQGPAKEDGALGSLDDGVYYFDNSGSVSFFDESARIWRVIGPGVNSSTYRLLQDSAIPGYDSLANTLLLATDSDKRAYLSFDYSSKAFVKFTNVDITFSTLGNRPEGEQWLMTTY